MTTKNQSKTFQLCNGILLRNKYWISYFIITANDDFYKWWWFCAHHYYSNSHFLSCVVVVYVVVNSSTTARNIRSQLSRGVVGLAIKYKTLPIGRAWMPYFRSFKTTSFAILEAYPVGPPSGTFSSMAKTHPMEMILSTESKALRRFNIVSSQNSFNRIDFDFVDDE